MAVEPLGRGQAESLTEERQIVPPRLRAVEGGASLGSLS